LHKTADQGQAAMRVEEVEAAVIRPIAKATTAAHKGLARIGISASHRSTTSAHARQWVMLHRTADEQPSSSEG